jgi:Zn-dependent peptidase ImmA (M78 family)
MATNPVTPEDAADIARKQLGVGADSAIPDILGLIEDSGLAVFIINLPDGGIDGAYQIQRDTPFILINQNAPPVRKRFTLAHEYGHHRLDHGAQIDEYIGFDEQNQVEQQANAFAAAFLMSRSAVDAWWASYVTDQLDLEGLVRFSSRFGTSAMASCFRLANLGKIDDALMNRLCTAIGAGEHLTLATANGVTALEDSIVSEGRHSAHMPFSTQAQVSDLLDRGLVDESGASKTLRLSPEETKTKLAEQAEKDWF